MAINCFLPTEVLKARITQFIEFYLLILSGLSNEEDREKFEIF